MDFWVLKVFKIHNLLERQLSNKKVMHLSTFKMFRRNNPINLPLDSGEEIQNPLLIPFLRQYILDEGEFFYTDEEIVKFFEPVVMTTQLDQMQPREREFVEAKYKQLQRQVLIKKVMDKQIQKLNHEVGQQLIGLEEKMKDILEKPE